MRVLLSLPHAQSEKIRKTLYYRNAKKLYIYKFHAIICAFIGAFPTLLCFKKSNFCVYYPPPYPPNRGLNTLHKCHIEEWDILVDFHTTWFILLGFPTQFLSHTCEIMQPLSTSAIHMYTYTYTHTTHFPLIFTRRYTTPHTPCTCATFDNIASLTSVHT